jgi:hypothetical protein
MQNDEYSIFKRDTAYLYDLGYISAITDPII